MLRLPTHPEARAAYDAQHALFLPRAAAPNFVTALQHLAAHGPWQPDPTTGAAFHFDSCPVPDELVAPLVAPDLLARLQQVTGVQGVATFEGELKRIRPGHRFPWHRDHRMGQRLGMSLCLSEDFDGGAFEIRWRWDDEALFRCQPHRPGDLHLIDVADGRLVHRVTEVTRGERVVLAGWWVAR